MKIKMHQYSALAFLLPICVAARLCAQTSPPTALSWPNCAELKAGDFRKVTLGVTHPASPTKMKIAPDGRMFFATQSGAIWTYDPKTAVTTTVANIPVSGGIFGLVGMQLSPNFMTDNWIYVLYGNRPIRLPSFTLSYQVWRYTLVNNKLDMGSGKMLLEYGADRAFPVDHSGGGMAFDAQGNLYFSTGENSDGSINFGNIDDTNIQFNSMRTSGNTNDLRGKVNRIHPEPDGKYTIPPGNLFPPGKDSTRPEIYAMGFRNPWSLDVDKPTGTLLVGDVGPQAELATTDKGPAGMDEFVATRTAGNFGWPMFIGPNVPYNNFDYAANRPREFFDKDAPVNNSRWNTGLKRLPPARPSMVAYGKDGLNNPLTGLRQGRRRARHRTHLSL